MRYVCVSRIFAVSFISSRWLIQYLQAFQFNKSGDKSFLELCGRSNSRQRSPVELAASQFAEVHRSRCLRQRVGERVDGSLTGLLTAPRFGCSRSGGGSVGSVVQLQP